MRQASILMLLSCLVSASAVTCDVLRVDDADAIMISYRDLHFSLPLAHLECSADDGFQAERIALLKEMLIGKKVDILRRDDYGMADDGRSPVHLRVDKALATEALLAKGLAAFKAGDKVTSYDRQLKKAEAAAKEAKLGRWGATTSEPEEPVIAIKGELPGGGRKSSVAQNRAPYAAELNGSYFYKADASELVNVNPQRLIFYASEADARKAGKRPAPKRKKSNAGGARDITSARAAFTRGERLYAEAIAAGNTSKRDDLYGEAFTELTAAVQIFSELLENDQDNEDLGEELRRAMQLRYGAMKQRRA